MAKFATNPKKQIKKEYIDRPWPTTDMTPRNGMCNQSDGTFKLLPNDGRKMFEWKWDGNHQK